MKKKFSYFSKMIKHDRESNCIIQSSTTLANNPKHFEYLESSNCDSLNNRFGKQQ